MITSFEAYKKWNNLQAQDAREVFNAIGVERTATTPTNMKGHVQNRLSNKYNEMMVVSQNDQETLGNSRVQKIRDLVRIA